MIRLPRLKQAADRDLASQLAMQVPQIQLLLPKLFAGEKGVERLQGQIRSLFLELWPIQRKERQQMSEELMEQQRVQVEIRANKNVMEPVFVLLPKKGATPEPEEPEPADEPTAAEDPAADKPASGESGATSPISGDSDSGTPEQDMEPEIQVQGQCPGAKAQRTPDPGIEQPDFEGTGAQDAAQAVSSEDETPPFGMNDYD